MTHVLALTWVVVYVIGFVVGLAVLARDWMRRRARQQSAMETQHAANDNRRGRRRARR